MHEWDADDYAGFALHDDQWHALRLLIGMPDERERLLGPDRGE